MIGRAIRDPMRWAEMDKRQARSRRLAPCRANELAQHPGATPRWHWAPGELEAAGPLLTGPQARAGAWPLAAPTDSPNTGATPMALGPGGRLTSAGLSPG